MQASRKCTLAPLTGVKPLTPYAAFGREVARPQVVKSSGRKRIAEARPRCLPLANSIAPTIRPRKPRVGCFLFKPIQNRPKRNGGHKRFVGDFIWRIFKKGL